MTQSQMEKEALEAPQVIAKQILANQTILNTIAARLRSEPSLFAMTIARGSSDHAATFAKYLIETRIGMITASAAPSVFTLYKSKLQLKNSLVLGISQSGASPDVADMLAYARGAGAITVAFVNQTDSALAAAAEYVVPILAGKEQAVAATKTYLATLSAFIQFVAVLTQDAALLGVMAKLPQALEKAAKMDWSAAIDIYLKAQNTLVIGRGYGYPIAQEAALKFKETARIHAEAFSGAELLHGPFALVEKNFPILLFAQQDESLPGILDVSQRMKTLGAAVMLALPEQVHAKQLLQEDIFSIRLPLPDSLHPICDPLLIIQVFYVMMARLSLARGLNPDAPLNLTKVTQTW
jgi:glucosamine--fructose-6-phosphate aminotransferase (isomerizing)